MLKYRLSSLAVAGLLDAFAVLAAGAAPLAEDFSSNPLARGWRVFGEPSLFRWNATNENLEVTWDSTQPNSYFFHSLGTVLAKEDDFSLAFDLRLSDIAGGVVPNRTGPFEIVVGFLNLAQATNAAFRRGTGTNSPNLVEFDYFPAGYYLDPVFGRFDVDPTVSPTIISTNHQFATGFTYPLELTTNDWFRVTLTYTASNQTLLTALLRNGQPYGPVKDVTLDATFTDFRVDTLSLTSYSGAGNDYDSVLAHGVVDNLAVTLPPPPVATLGGGFVDQLWQVQFNSTSNWLYTLERTADFAVWTPVSPETWGNGAVLRLQETNHAGGGQAFYRVNATRP